MTAARETVAILGVGLLGGSIGLALRSRGLCRRVIGVGRRLERLQAAVQRGAVTEISTDLAAAAREAQLIVVCTPVHDVAGFVTDALRDCSPDALVTDVGSTKSRIVAEVEQWRRANLTTGGHFVGSHPLAGSEKTGVEYADPDLFVNRAVIVTPTAETPSDSVDAIAVFWRALGGRVRIMTADEHDDSVASISHLPHLVAAVLAAATPTDLLDLVAGGWRDTTRVASGDVELWRQIFDDNREHVLRRLDHFHSTLADFRRALHEQDDAAIRRLLEAGKTIRDAVGN